MERKVNWHDLYETACEFVRNSENLTWERLNTFLLSNSILVLAWATIFSALKEHESPSSYIVLIVIAVLGIVVTCYLGHVVKRTREHLELDFKQGLHIEKKLVYEEGVREAEVKVELGCDEKVYKVTQFAGHDQLRERVPPSLQSRKVVAVIVGSFLILYIILIAISVVPLLPRP